MCFVPKIDLHYGDIDSHDCHNDTQAAKICGDILKDRTKYVLWFRSINKCIFKNISTVSGGFSKGDHYGGSFFIGKKISSYTKEEVHLPKAKTETEWKNISQEELTKDVRDHMGPGFIDTYQMCLLKKDDPRACKVKAIAEGADLSK